MKKSFIINFIFVSITSFLITSCFKDVDLSNYKPSPKIVLNSIVSSDTVVMVSISRTWFFTDENPNVIIPDANVQLFVNGCYYEKLEYKPDISKDNLNTKGLYVSTFIPQPGDKIKILAETIYGTSIAEDILPEKVSIINVDITYKVIPGPISIFIDKNGNIHERYDNLELSYYVEFEKLNNDINYYFVRIEECDFRQPLGILNYASDPIFTNQDGILDNAFSGIILEGQGGRVFSDELIKENKYTMLIKEIGSRDINYDYGTILNRKICLYSISHDYYKFLLSLQNLHDDNLMNNLADLGMAEPVQIYNNVIGGVGILAGCQFSYTLKDIRSILPDY